MTKSKSKRPSSTKHRGGARCGYSNAFPIYSGHGTVSTQTSGTGVGHSASLSYAPYPGQIGGKKRRSRKSQKGGRCAYQQQMPAYSGNGNPHGIGAGTVGYGAGSVYSLRAATMAPFTPLKQAGAGRRKKRRSSTKSK